MLWTLGMLQPLDSGNVTIMSTFPSLLLLLRISFNSPADLYQGFMDEFCVLIWLCFILFSFHFGFILQILIYCRHLCKPHWFLWISSSISVNKCSCMSHPILILETTSEQKTPIGFQGEPISWSHIVEFLIQDYNLCLLTGEFCPFILFMIYIFRFISAVQFWLYMHCTFSSFFLSSFLFCLDEIFLALFHFYLCLFRSYIKLMFLFLVVFIEIYII